MAKTTDGKQQTGTGATDAKTPAPEPAASAAPPSAIEMLQKQHAAIQVLEAKSSELEEKLRTLTRQYELLLSRVDNLENLQFTTASALAPAMLGETAAAPPPATELTVEERRWAADAVDVQPEDILAAKFFEDRVVVVTVAGQRLIRRRDGSVG